MNQLLASNLLSGRAIWSGWQSCGPSAIVPLLQNLHMTNASGMHESLIAILSADLAPCVRLKMPNTKHSKRKRKIHRSIRMDSTNQPAISTASPRQIGTGINGNLNRFGADHKGALSHG